MRVQLSPFAKIDLAEAKSYYKNINHDLAKDFLAEVKKAKAFISENPLANDFSYNIVRTHLLARFPYHLHYIINGEKQTIVIIAVEFAKRGDIDFSHRIYPK